MDITKLTNDQVVRCYAKLRLAGTAVVDAAEIMGDTDTAEHLAKANKGLMRTLSGELKRRGLTDKAKDTARHLEKSVLGPVKDEAA